VAGYGLVQMHSKYSVADTVQRLEAAFREKGLQVFAVIDHSGEAENVGLTMRPTKGRDLRESEGWDPADGGRSEPGD
jgi:hypothetical protein